VKDRLNSRDYHWYHWNKFTDWIYDQKGNQARPNYRTKATIKLLEWKEDHKFLDIYRINNPTGRELTYLKDGMDRRSMDKGNRLDKFLLSEDLCIKEVEIKHTKDYFYTEKYGMQGHSFDHSSVRITFNKTRKPTGPGQFKLDPLMIKTGCWFFLRLQIIFSI
jgi:exonuclease III